MRMTRLPDRVPGEFEAAWEAALIAKARKIAARLVEQDAMGQAAGDSIEADLDRAESADVADQARPSALAKAEFNPEMAKAMLAGLKVGGMFPRRPSVEEAQAKLSGIFATVPRDPVRAFVTALWGSGRTGPRSPRNSRKSAK
jgi:hypothetical protein